MKVKKITYEQKAICKYCKDIASDYKDGTERIGTEFLMRDEDTGNLCIASCTSYRYPRQVARGMIYCPMCGRKLD